MRLERKNNSEQSILKKEVVEAIVENKEIEYPIREYYRTYYILQKNKEIKEEQENKDTDVLHTAAEYYSENIKAENNLEKEKKRNISIDAVGPNENMIVDN